MKAKQDKELTLISRMPSTATPLTASSVSIRSTLPTGAVVAMCGGFYDGSVSPTNARRRR
jgi:hypothetical protein